MRGAKAYRIPKEAPRHLPTAEAHAYPSIYQRSSIYMYVQRPSSYATQINVLSENKGYLPLDDMASITPFVIDIDESRLSRLHQKLQLTDFPPELDQAGWTYGAPLSDITRLTKYWKDGFDWRKQEAELNKLPQFTTNITVDGFEELNVHFVHQRSPVEGAIPLLFIHGCTGILTAVTL